MTTSTDACPGGQSQDTRRGTTGIVQAAVPFLKWRVFRWVFLAIQLGFVGWII